MTNFGLHSIWIIVLRHKKFKNKHRRKYYISSLGRHWYWYTFCVFWVEFLERRKVFTTIKWMIYWFLKWKKFWRKLGDDNTTPLTIPNILNQCYKRSHKQKFLFLWIEYSHKIKEIWKKIWYIYWILKEINDFNLPFFTICND